MGLIAALSPPPPTHTQSLTLEICMQNECQVSLNTVDSVENLVADINGGRWDAVLPQVAQLKLPRGKLEDLYEQVRVRVRVLRERKSRGPGGRAAGRWLAGLMLRQ